MKSHSDWFELLPPGYREFANKQLKISTPMFGVTSLEGAIWTMSWKGRHENFWGKLYLWAKIPGEYPLPDLPNYENRR